MAKIPMSEALAQLPSNTAELVHAIFKHNLSDDFLVDLEGKKIHVNFPAPQVILDIHATGATLDPDTFVLTVNRENGEPFNVDLEKLAESQIRNEATSAVTLSGKGTKADPLKADVKLSAESNNIIRKDNQGNLIATLPEQRCLTLRDIFGDAIGPNGQDIKVVLCGDVASSSGARPAASYDDEPNDI